MLYADDLSHRDPGGYAALVGFARSHRAVVFGGFDDTLYLFSQSEFVRHLLWFEGYRHRATIVGFNLPFDLSRLAIDCAPARRDYTGGNSLTLFDDERFRPRIVYKTLDSKRSFIAFTRFDGKDEKTRGHYLDLHTFSTALADRDFTLEQACVEFGLPYSKRKVTHGIITEENIEYCREDVGATAQLLHALMAEHGRHPIDVPATKVFSQASIGKGYLRQMGIRPVLARQADFDRSVLGRAMTVFFGGRAECRIRKEALPVVPVDFLSMYPTVNALMGTWSLVTARKIMIDDATITVRRLLARPDLGAACFEPAFWRDLVCLVEIEPDGDLVPVRARYDRASQDYGIGVNPYRSPRPAWYALADLIASVLLGGRTPVVRRAVALRGVGRQSGLYSVKLRDMVPIDPAAGDFFRQTIELRRRVGGDEGVDATDRDRLGGFLKILANSTGYGIWAEFQRSEGTKPVRVTVYAEGDEPWSATTTAPETPGEFCFPPVAACITAGARLMLALLETAAPGLHYVYCDTDSMGLVADPEGGLHACPGGLERLPDGREAVRALSYRQVDEIVDRFAALTPYDRAVVPGSILQIERENFDEEGERRQLWCYCISAKRYALFVPGGRGSVDQLVTVADGVKDDEELARASRHGLGHLLDPMDPDDTSGGWIEMAWTYMLAVARGMKPQRPGWFERPAVTRVTASGPTVLGWFAALNRGKPYAERVKPANFLLLAHPDPMDGSGALPVAPFEKDPRRWLDLEWLDRRDGRPLRVTTDPLDGTERPGWVRLRTYGEVIAQYMAHPESKSLGPDGQPGGRDTRGLLRRHPVEDALVIHIGKEANKWEDRFWGIVTDPCQYLTEYADPDHDAWSELVHPTLRTMSIAHLARSAGLHRRSIERYFNGAHPRTAHEAVLTKLALEHATVALRAWALDVPRSPWAVLQLYLSEGASRARRC